MSGPLSAYSSDGLDPWPLTRFDLRLDLDAERYGVQVHLKESLTDGRIYQVHVPNLEGDLLLSQPQGFSFASDDTYIQLNEDMCSGCEFSAQGFLAGPEAQKAGVGYTFKGTDEILYGVAPLKKAGIDMD